MERKFKFSIGEFYHLYNRGNDKRAIFHEPNDYNRFLALLYVCNGTNPVDISKHFSEGRTFAEILTIERGEQIVDIGAYCLMPNHFHLLIRENRENGISLFMRKLLTGYSMYYNKKHKHSGSLFESKFKATHANSDEYLKYLFSYIHLNPIKLIDAEWKEKGITDKVMAKQYLRGYKYSSYDNYILNGNNMNILNKSAFPDYFSEFNNFENFIDEWLNFNNAKVRPSRSI
jgi:putative transposase